MAVRVGINGFGRIGRAFYRAVRARPELEVDVVAVNDVQPAADLANLLEYDTVAGRFEIPVSVTPEGLRVGKADLRLLHEPTPAAIPWRLLGADVVVESSRLFTAAAKARGHLDAGASRVVVSAPSEGADATFVVGVNDHTFDPSAHFVVSNASCTTNCLAPMVRVLDESFGIEEGLMTTVHAYTSDQSLVDGPGHGDARRGRAAAVNIVPAATGAARAVRHVLPALAGRLDGSALRVPVVDGSVTDLTVNLARPVSVAEVNEAFRSAAASGPLAGVLEYSERPIVSSDVVGVPASCVFDAPLTTVCGRMVKVFGWYDNEWGYANRLVDLVAMVGSRR